MSEISEYNSLRTELLQVNERQLQTTTFALTVTVAIIGLGIRDQDYRSFIMLVPLIILFFAEIQMVSQAYSTMRIATYIHTFIERDNENLNWETHMRIYRQKVKSSRLLSRLSWPSYQLVLVSTGWICVILSILFALSSSQEDVKLIPNVILSLSAALLWLVSSIWFLRRMNLAVSGVVEKEFDRLWSAAKEVANKGS